MQVLSWSIFKPKNRTSCTSLLFKVEEDRQQLWKWEFPGINSAKSLLIFVRLVEAAMACLPVGVQNWRYPGWLSGWKNRIRGAPVIQWRLERTFRPVETGACQLPQTVALWGLTESARSSIHNSYRSTWPNAFCLTQHPCSAHQFFVGYSFWKTEGFIQWSFQPIWTSALQNEVPAFLLPSAASPISTAPSLASSSLYQLHPSFAACLLYFLGCQFPGSVSQFSHCCVQPSVTPWTAARQASLSITNSQSPPKPMSIESVMPSNHLILCRPLLLLPSIFPSIRVFSNESALCIRLPKYWSFSFNISPSNEHPGMISFRMDWLDLLAVQGTLKSLLQHHSSKASVFQHSAFFVLQLSHPYMTTGKTTALTRWSLVGKVMSLLFNMLSRLVITFLPRSKHLLISWLQSPSAVILEPPKIKSATVSPAICHEVMGLHAVILVFWMLSFKSTFHSPLSLSPRGSLALLPFLP